MTIIEQLQQRQQVIWDNPQVEQQPTTFLFDAALIDEAERRLQRFAPYFMLAFPETSATNGIIESPLASLEQLGHQFKASLFVKRDDILPVSGSIKARGGIHEVLVLAESIALQAGLLTTKDSYTLFAEQAIIDELSNHTIVVGSTGNLGLSIGMMSAKLGFRVVVHMSHDAKQWKKDMLREKGVQVVEHAGDYSVAVETGRKQAEDDTYSHFIDDENSQQLFAGYAVAARRLANQLPQKPTTASPLVVYIPCGVGGGPGGVIYGLKAQFGAAVKCFMVEPVESPCMLLGMATGKHDAICVEDIGLTNQTIADGLAVGRASRFVGRLMEPLLDGVLTVSDTRLRELQQLLWTTERIYVEPSAAAGFEGAVLLASRYPTAQHLVWATGGGLVPATEKSHDFI